MDNKVGDELPTEAEIEEAVRAVQKVRDKAARYLISLTKDQRSSALKPRIGYEQVVPKIAALVTKHGVALPQMSVEGMLADLALVQRLAPLRSAVDSFAEQGESTQIQAASECWYAATAYYTSLLRVSGGNPELERELRPIVEFFAVGKRKPKTP